VAIIGFNPTAFGSQRRPVLRQYSPDLVRACDADEPLGLLTVTVDRDRGDRADARLGGEVAVCVGVHAEDRTRFRQRGRSDVESYDATAFERDAYTSVVAGSVDALEEAGSALAPTAPDGSMPYRAGGAVAADVDVYERSSSLGDTGAASALFGLITAWEAGEDDVVVVGYGDGASATAIRLTGSIRVEIPDETTSITYDDYLRKRGHIVSDDGGVN